jgi:glyoxylase-like metal-dependent hydrolase (beta-lactamase superfamily II)
MQMNRKIAAAVFAGIFMLHGAWVVLTQTAKPPGPLRIERVKPDLFMISGEGGNVAVDVTSDGVILVDDMFDRNHADILAQVKSVTDKPLKYVLNTHQHDDHAGGNDKMLPLVEVIAHENVRANLIAKRKPFYEDTPGTPIGLPRVTFSKELSVFLGGKEARAVHFGRGHTSGDAIIYFPEHRTVHTGDLFLGRRPARPGAPAPSRPAGVSIFVDYSQGGSFFEWTKTLDGLLSLDFDTVIPGHGAVSSRDDVVSFRAELGQMQTRFVQLARRGTSRDEMIRILETDYGWRSTGCPPAPPTPGCLQYQQVDAFIAELKK